MTAMKKRHFYILFPAVLFLLGMFFLGWIWKTECENTAYGTLSAFCRELSGQQTTEGQILVALKKSQNRDIGEEKEEFLERYGYRREDFAGFDSRAFFCVSAFSVVVLAAGLALLVGRHAIGGIVDTVIVGCLRGAGLLRAESGACGPALLKGIPLFLFRIPVDGPQDKQNHRQPGDGAQQDQQENGGDAGKIVFVLQLHRDETS